jgi:hypothetical protein
VELRVAQTAAVPGTRTPADHPIIRAAVKSWEEVAGAQHQLIGANSGATDANILRLRGVPTARIGMPKVGQGPDGEPVDFTLGMNLVDLREMRRLVEVLVRTVVHVREDGAVQQEAVST